MHLHHSSILSANLAIFFVISLFLFFGQKLEQHVEVVPREELCREAREVHQLHKRGSYRIVLLLVSEEQLNLHLDVLVSLGDLGVPFVPFLR